ncbi:MAG: class I SAM-dependent methyltransferase [Alphaproteobacteria bacterium]|nr:class I SAM-dependent methyltransferase [Alphaproteobacteria bacterium]
MPCASYTDPRLAAVYDPLNPPDIEDDFHLALAGDNPRTILDMGCGTGRLASALAARGHRVAGVDPAPAMLDIAQRRPGGDRITWVLSGAAELSLDARFDLIVMTGHVFQVFLDDDDIRAALSTLRRHLATDGRITFATRNRAVEAWKSWVPEATRERIEVPGIGIVEVHYDIRSVEGALVTFETHFCFGPGDSAVTASTLRFMTQDEVAHALGESGLDPVTWYGDWDGSPFHVDSPEIIVIARKGL